MFATNRAASEDDGGDYGSQPVIISGFKEGSKREVIRMFLEDEGDIKSFKYSEKTRRALVQYEDFGATEALLANESLYFEGNLLTVTPAKDEGSQALIISGFEEGSKKELIKLFLEDEGDLKSFEFNDTTMEAIIEYKDFEVREMLLADGSLEFEGNLLKVISAQSVEAVQNAILVEGITEQMSNENVKTYFKLKKVSDKGNITCLFRSEMSAVIIFKESKSVDSVMAKKDHSFLETPLSVSIYKGSREALESNYQRSGEFPVDEDPGTRSHEETSQGKQRKRACVPKVADQFKPKESSDRPFVSVKPQFYSPDQDRSKHEAVYPRCEDTGMIKSHAIQVLGVKNERAAKTLEKYLQNPKRSGGGRIIDKHHNEESGVYTFTFESPEDVDNILRRQHELDGVQLKIERLSSPELPHIEGPYLANTVSVHGLTPDITSDELTCHLESLTENKCLVTGDPFYGPDKSAAIVVFDEEPDYQHLIYQFKKYPFQGTMLGVQRVQKPTSIQVLGIDGIKNESLELYFENTKRSGGCQDATVEVHDNKFAIVQFPDNIDLKEICQRDHSIEGKNLNVSIYYDCLGLFSENEEELQETSIHINNKHMFMFVLQSTEARVKIDKALSPLHGTVDWTCGSPQSIMVKYDKAEYRKEGSLMHGEWKASVFSAVMDIIKEITSKEIVCSGDVWPKIKDNCQKIADSESMACVTMEKSCKKIIITGFTEKVSSIYSQLLKQKEEIEKNIKIACEGITKKMELNQEVVLLLKALNFTKLIKQKYPNLKVTLSERQISFSGIEEEINKAKLEMLEIIHKKVEEPLTMNTTMLQLLCRNEARAHIEHKMRQESVVAVWKEIGNSLVLYALDDQSKDKAKSIIMKEISNASMEIPSAAKLLVQTPVWEEFLAKQKDFHQGLFSIDILPGEGQLNIVAIQNIAPKLLHSLESFFQVNSIENETFSIKAGASEVLVRFMKDELESIKKDLGKYAVVISYEKKQDRSITFKIGGMPHGLSRVKERLQVSLKKIIKDEFEIKEAGMQKFFDQPQGQQYLEGLEETHSVVILSSQFNQSKSRNPPASEEKSSKPKEIAWARDQCGTVIMVQQHDLTKHTVDVVINAANTDLKHSGGLAKALCDIGGEIIQQQSDQYVQRHTKLLDGQVAVTDAGRLPCRKIIHAVGPMYRGRPEEEDFLAEAVWNSLQKVDDLRLATVAFPPISTGIFNFPLKSATKIIADTIKEYLVEKEGKTTIKEIHLVDNNKDGAEAFSEALSAEYEIIRNDGTTGVVHKVKGRTRTKTDPEQLSTDMPIQVPMTQSLAQALPVTVNSQANGFTTPEGISVLIELGSIASAKADVIVNTCSKDLNLAQGAVSISLLQVGGNALQDEVLKNKPSPYNYGDIIVTSNCGLPCDEVYHAAFPFWKDGAENAKQVLQQFLPIALDSANKFGHKSIALPAIGTGNLSYPRDFVAVTMLNEVIKFSKNCSTLNLTDVFIVLYDKDHPTIQAFQKFIQKLSESDQEVLSLPAHEIPPYVPQPTRKVHKTEDSDKGGFFSTIKGYFTSQHDPQPGVTRHSRIARPPQNQNISRLWIYGTSQKHIRDTKEKLSEICKANRQEKIIGDKEEDATTISNLTPEQIQSIQNLESTYTVKINIQQGKRVNRIQISGIATDLVAVVEAIHNKFRKLEKEKYAEQQTLLFNEMVTWQYADGLEFIDYPEELNGIIESAYRDALPCVEWEEEGERYKLDFQEKKEYSHGQGIRSVKRKEKGSDIALPDNWTPMSENDRHIMVPLSATDTEHDEVKKRFMNTIGRYSSSACIEQVQRIQNPSLYRRYQVHKEYMTKQNPDIKEIERFLWHGTDADTIQKINDQGFNRSYCGKNATYYGNGVYFAKTSEYSTSYAREDSNKIRHMYFCRVLCGDYTKGEKGYKSPPPKDPAKPSILYDSVVDDMQDPIMFIVFNDTQAYPEYLVSFKV